MIRKKNNKSEFDLLYLKSMEFYKEMGKKAFDTLQSSAYYTLKFISKGTLSPIYFIVIVPIC